MNENASLLVRLGADFNGDGRFSASDLEGWLFELLILPGNALIGLLIEHVPGIAGFLELTTDDYDGVIAICASIVIWLAAILIAGMILRTLIEFDRRLTAWLAGRFAETLRLGRILRRRVACLVLAVTRRRGADEDGIEIGSVDLANLETAVLRCLSQAEDGVVLTGDQIAERLHRPAREIGRVIRRLDDLGFVETGTDSLTKSAGLRIATAGQMYLLGA